jgi:hypothetical protein
MRHAAGVRAWGTKNAEVEGAATTELTAAAAAVQSKVALAAVQAFRLCTRAASSAADHTERLMLGHRELNQRTRKSHVSWDDDPQ